MSGLLYVVLNWNKFTFEVFQLSIKLTRKLITWTAADSIKIAQSDKQVNPAQLMEMLMQLIGQIIHRKAPRTTKYMPAHTLTPSPKKIVAKILKDATPEITKIDEQEEEKDEQKEEKIHMTVEDTSQPVSAEQSEEPKVDKTEEQKEEKPKDENTEQTDNQEATNSPKVVETMTNLKKSKSPSPSSNAKLSDKRSRRRSMSRSRLLSRYALKTKDSGEFCVVAQGNETVHKWKDVLCHREFEFLLPEITADDEEGAFLYLVVSEDSDTEVSSEEDEEDKRSKTEQLRMERRKIRKMEELAAKKKRMKHKLRESTESQVKPKKIDSSFIPPHHFYLPSGYPNIYAL